MNHVDMIFFGVVAIVIGVFFSLILLPAWVLRYQKWKQDRADRKLIAESIGFMSRWQDYDKRKAAEESLHRVTTRSVDIVMKHLIEDRGRREYGHPQFDARKVVKREHYLDGVSDAEVIEHCAKHGK